MDVLISAILIILICGLIVFLLSEAPFLATEWKALGRWVVLVIGVLWIIALLAGRVHPFPVLR